MADWELRLHQTTGRGRFRSLAGLARETLTFVVHQQHSDPTTHRSLERDRPVVCLSFSEILLASLRIGFGALNIYSVTESIP